MRLVAFLLLFGCPGAEAKKPGRIYDTAYGSVYCADYYWHECGVHLSKCHDGHEYWCMHNVRERGE